MYVEGMNRIVFRVSVRLLKPRALHTLRAVGIFFYFLPEPVRMLTLLLLQLAPGQRRALKKEGWRINLLAIRCWPIEADSKED